MMERNITSAHCRIKSIQISRGSAWRLRQAMSEIIFFPCCVAVICNEFHIYYSSRWKKWNSQTGHCGKGRNCKWANLKLQAETFGRLSAAAGEASAGSWIKRSANSTIRTGQINSLRQNVSFTSTLEDYFCRFWQSAVRARTNVTPRAGKRFSCWVIRTAPTLIWKPVDSGR